MFSNKYLYFNDWENFYDSENETQKEQIYIFGNFSSRRSYSKGKVYVINSIFEDLEEQEKGGGIYFNSNDDNSKLLVEDSQFVNCVTYISGGGIYKATNGHSVLHRVCGFECKVSAGSNDGSDGPFSNIHSSPGCYNYIIESQVSHCNSSWGCTIHMSNGNCYAKYQNISYNNCIRFSGIKYTTSGICNTSYSSLNNNTLYEFGVFGIDCAGNSNLHSSNIIYNTMEDTAWGLLKITTSTNIRISDTCIYGNDINAKTFYVDGTSTITLYNCTVDDKSANKEINTDSLSPSPKSFFHMLKLLATGKCYGTFDVVEGITFDSPTPEPTQSLTPKYHLNDFTCKQTKTTKFHTGILNILLTRIKEI